jgi:hypothetical protein
MMTRDSSITSRRQYAVSGDGRRFLLNLAERRTNNAAPLIVTLNWRPPPR